MKQITGLQRREDTIIRIPFQGDNWHTTWTEPDAQLVLMCDGQGYNTRLWRLVGDPPAIRFEPMPGYPELASTLAPEAAPLINRYYGFGIIAFDGQIFHFFSTPNHYFHLPGARFIGAKLIYSPDNGQTWLNQNGGPIIWETWAERSRKNMVFFQEPGACFSLLSILQMGRNYALNQDGYLYIYAPNGNLEGTMNQLVMLRVPKTQLRQRQAYEFFVARRPDGTAIWSPNIADRGVVLTFPAGWVNQKFHPYTWHPCVVYNPGLDCYLLLNWGMGTDGDFWFTKPSYFGAWIATTPWGPWIQIHAETAWMPGGDPQARAYQPQIPPKWISPDGQSFWLVWTDFQILDQQQPYYSYNLQQVEVLIE